MEHRLIITIDGPGAAGKSTVARLLAQKLGYTYVDSGAMYRSFALAALRGGISVDDEAGIARLCDADELSFRWDGASFRCYWRGIEITEEIRGERMGEPASIYSVVPRVRQFLTELQRRMAAEEGVVVEGRDAGTVVFPQADLKVFLTASLEARVERRSGETSTQPSLTRDDLLRRDQRDSGRDTAPLAVAPGSVIVDSTGLSVPQVTERVLGQVARVLARQSGGE